jgi:hypothetical protein
MDDGMPHCAARIEGVCIQCRLPKKKVRKHVLKYWLAFVVFLIHGLPVLWSKTLYQVRPAVGAISMCHRTIRGNAVDQTLRLFKRIRHPNILSPQECFLYEDSVFILHDDIPVSLDHIVACEAYLDEVELAAILSQILDGLLYLANRRIEHPCLSSSNILVTGRGQVKTGTQNSLPLRAVINPNWIAALEQCVELQADRMPRYCKPLERITMELMQKYEKEDNKTGVDDVERWPCDSHATGPGQRAEFDTGGWRSAGSFKSLSWSPRT